MSFSQELIHRAVRIAMDGRGHVEPNPMVGCVIVKDGRVIGEGLHQQYGRPHAEPNALANCTESPEGATAYVTLEPCCHTNKQTPPCVPRLIAAKIARVVVGCLDPNPDVNGKGVQQLRDAGIAVEAPMLADVCRQLIAAFTARVDFNRPYVTMKWAESADGKIAGPGGMRVQISNRDSSHQVQLLRSRCDAIVIGINTALNDDPMLLPRDVPMIRPYRRIVLDRDLRLPVNSQLVTSLDQGPVIVFTTAVAGPQHLENLGVQVMTGDWLQWLGEEKVSHVLIEPGPRLAAALLHKVDRLWVIRSPKSINDAGAPSSAPIPDHFTLTGQTDLAGDILCEYLNTRSDVYFANAPSADFVLAS